MPNYEGGSVEIEIKSTADKARASLESLSTIVKQIKGDFQHLIPVFTSVNKLANGLRTIEKLNMSKVSTQIDAVGAAIGRMSANLARTDLSGFNTQSEQAAFALNRLTNSFRQLDKLQQIDTRRVYQDLDRLGRISSVGVEKLATALKAVDLTSIKTAGTSINTLVNGLQKIQGLKLDTNITGNLKSQLDALAPTLTSFLRQLQDINTDGLQRLTAALKALPKSMQIMETLNTEKIGGVFSSLTSQIQPFLARLREASAELQAFATIAKTFGGTNIAKSLNIATSSAQKFGSVFSSIGSKAKQAVTNLVNAIRRLGFESNKTNKSLTSVFSIGKIYFFLNYTKRAVQSLGNMFKSAIDFVEIENLFSRSMGNMRTEAIKFQNTLSEVFGVALPDMMKSQALFNNIVKQLGGINEEMSYGISETLVKMSLDFSALYNTSVEKAFDTFQAALTGQVKPVRRIAGMDITQATLQTYLDEAGINRTVRGLNQIEKRLLTVYSLQRQMAESRAIGAYADEIENAANQLKILTEQVKEFGRWIGSIFMGTLGRVLPYLNGFVMALKEIAKTLALLVGYKLPDSSNLNDQLGLEDATDGLGSVADGVEKIKQASTGIDELNIVSPAQAGAVAGAGDLVDPAILGLLQEYDNLMDSVRMKALDIRDAILEWLGFTIKLNEMGGIDLIPPTFDEDYFYDLGYRLAKLINAGLEKIPWDSIKESVTKIATNIASFLNGAVAGLDWNLVGTTIGESINTALIYVYTWLTTFDFLAWGVAIATGLNRAIATVDWSLLGATIAAKIMSTFNVAYGFVTTFDWAQFAVSVGTAINSAFASIDWTLIAQTFSIGFLGILTSLRTLISTIDWKQIGEDIRTFISSIDWAAIAAQIVGLIVDIFKGVTELLGPALSALALVLVGAFSVSGIVVKIAQLIVYAETLASAFNLAGAGISAAFSGAALVIAGVVLAVGGLIAIFTHLYETSEEFRTKINEVWENVKSSASEAVEKLQSLINTLWTEFLSPILTELSETLQRLWNNVLEPIYEKLFEFIGKLIELILELWNKVLQPFVNFIIKKVAPLIVNAVKVIIDIFETFFTTVGGVVEGILTSLTGVIDFLVGVFEGDWKRAFEGLLSVFAGFGNAIISVFEGVVNFVIDLVNGLISWILRAITDAVNKILGAVEWVADVIGLDLNLQISTDAFVIPHLKMPRVPIPTFARGGFPEDGFFFANSSELIGSVAGRTAVANNDQIVAAVSQGVAQAVAAVLSAQQPRQDNRPISVVIDGREVVRAVRNGEADMGNNPIGGAFVNA